MTETPTTAASEVARTATTKKNEELEDDLPQDTPGEATLLVSEFPPPPFYYNTYSSLEAPLIPTEALRNGTERAALAAAQARAEAERHRLGDDEHTHAILGGTVSKDDDDNVVAVFGEIVEDPWLVQPLDACEDPTVVRDEMQRLNARVLQLFVQLVQDLVHRPMENKKTRDELSHNVFLMLQECNKFREHQAHETLIELLEKQLAQRKQLVRELQSQMNQVREQWGEVMDE